MTSSGIFFLIVSFFGVFSKNWLLYILIVSSIFQASVIVNTSSFSIPVYSFVQVVFVGYHLIQILFKNSFTYNKKEIYIYMIAISLFVWSLISISYFPIIFEGEKIFSPKISIDDQYGQGNQQSLSFSISNIVQLIYLFLNILTFIFVAKMVQKIDSENIKRVLLITFMLSCIFSSYSIYKFLFDKIPIIEDFLYNNLSYAIGSEQKYELFARISGSFLEPSSAGSFYAAYSAAFLMSYHTDKKTILYFLIAIFFLILTTSTSGYVSFLLTVFIFTIINIFNSMKRNTNKISSVYIIKIVIPLFLVCLLFIIYTDIFLKIYEFVFTSKADSSSMLHREFANNFSFHIFLNTFGLGVGLGSNRPSSFIYYILSNLGFIGFLIVVYFLYKVITFSNQNKFYDEIKFYYILLTTIVISMCLAIPDISYSYIWLFSGILFGYLLKKGQFNDNN